LHKVETMNQSQCNPLMENGQGHLLRFLPELDAVGRFATPGPGEARFEMDATRTRRGPLEACVLGAPDSRRGALTHVRLVTSGPLLTFGHRDIGRVELTEVGADRVCGRVELDDGFGRVRGAFMAPVIGRPPD